MIWFQYTLIWVSSLQSDGQRLRGVVGHLRGEEDLAQEVIKA